MKNLVAAALMNLSRLEPSRLVALDEVVPTLSALAKTEDEDTRRVCATALRNLSGNEDSQAQMMQVRHKLLAAPSHSHVPRCCTLHARP